MKRWVRLALVTVVAGLAACSASHAPAPSLRDLPIESAEDVALAPYTDGLPAAPLEQVGFETLSQRALFMVGGDAETRLLLLDVEKSAAEAPDAAVVQIWRDGFLDDSVRGDWHELSFEFREGEWHLARVRRAQRCWREGNGYQAQPCL